MSQRPESNHGRPDREIHLPPDLDALDREALIDLARQLLVQSESIEQQLAAYQAADAPLSPASHRWRARAVRAHKVIRKNYIRVKDAIRRKNLAMAAARPLPTEEQRAARGIEIAAAACGLMKAIGKYDFSADPDVLAAMAAVYALFPTLERQITGGGGT